MGLFDGFVEGAAKVGSEGLMAQHLANVDRQKQEALTQMREELGRETHKINQGVNEEFAIRGEGRTEGYKIEAEKRNIENQGLIAENKKKLDLQYAERERKVKVDDKLAEGAAQTQIDVERFNKLAPLERQKAIDDLKAMASPEALAASRKIAQSKHIVDPSYTLVPQADGTIVTFDSKSGRSGGTLKDADGKPIQAQNPEQQKLAATIINTAHKDKQEASSLYKTEVTRLNNDLQMLPEQKAAELAQAKRALVSATRAADAQITTATAALMTKLDKGAVPTDSAPIRNPASGKWYVQGPNNTAVEVPDPNSKAKATPNAPAANTPAETPSRGSSGSWSSAAVPPAGNDPEPSVRSVAAHRAWEERERARNRERMQGNAASMVNRRLEQY